MRSFVLLRTVVLGTVLLSSPADAQIASLAALDSLTLQLAADSSRDRRPFDAAMLRIGQAIDRDSRDPRGWHYLGRTLQAMSDRRLMVKTTPYHPPGITYRRGAFDAYTRAIKSDSTYLPAAEALAQLIVSMRARKLNQDFTRQLVVAGRQPGAPAVIHLALSRLAWSDGKYVDALREANQYATIGDSGVAAIEIARARAALNQLDEAEKAYLRGLRSVSAAGKDAYREDIGWVASPDEATVFDSLPVDSVGHWVAAFWTKRDALEMRQPGERLREHLRRWVYVHQAFALIRPDDAPIHTEGIRDSDQGSVVEGNDPYLSIVLAEAAFSGPGFNLYQRTQWEVDDRGVIYMRHGEPTRRISTPTGPPNESWLYRRSMDQPVFHFLSSHALGTTAATTLVASLPLSPEMLSSRGELDPRYQALGDYIQGRRDMMKAYFDSPNPERNLELERAFKALQEGRNPRSAMVLAAIASANAGLGAPTEFSMASVPSLSTTMPHRIREAELRTRAAVREAIASDGFPQAFARELEAVVQLHGLGVGAGELRRLLAVYAIDGGSLVGQRRPDGNPGWFYPVSIRLIALDQLGGVVRQLDTVRNYVTRDSLRAGQHLTGFIEMTLPVGFYRTRMLIQSAGIDAAAVGARDGVDLLSPSDTPMMSDLVLGRTETGVVWRLKETDVPLNPLNAFPRGSIASLFYQLSGLSPGTVYETQVLVRKATDDPMKKPLLQVTTEFTAEAAERNISQGVGLQELKPGGYQLVVRVAVKGETAALERSRALNILAK